MTNVGEKEAGLGRRDGALESRRCGALRRRVARFATAMGHSVAEALRPLMERSPAWGGRRGVRTAGTGMGGDALPQGPVPVAALPARVPGGADPGGSGATAKRWLRRRFGGGRRSARGGLALDAGLWAALRRGADGLPMATPGNGTAGAFGQGIQGDYASGHRRGVRRAGTGVGGGALPRGPVPVATLPSRAPGGSRVRRRVCTFALAGIVRESVQFLAPNDSAGGAGRRCRKSSTRDAPGTRRRRAPRRARLRRAGGAAASLAPRFGCSRDRNRSFCLLWTF